MVDLSRRRVLGLLGAGAAAGLAGRRLLGSAPATTAASGSGATHTAITTPRPAAVTTAPATTATTTAPPPRPRYQTIEGEVYADAKLAAVQVVEALTTFAPNEPAEAIVARAAVDAVDGIDLAVVAERAAPLVVTGAASTSWVVYPQLGGLDPHADPVTCSVMVIVAQRLERFDRTEELRRCVDVRLRRLDGLWRLEGLADTSRQPVPRPPLGGAAARALDHPQLDLPDSARWDVHEGVVDDRVLAVLADLADQQPIGVTCFRRGHPDNVFGTTRLSAHTVGRAVDVWRIGDRPVVQQQPDESSAAHTLARQLFEGRTVSNLGCPWSFDGPGGRSFTDPVHDDHLHLGISA